MNQRSITSLTLVLGLLLIVGCNQPEASEADTSEQIAETTETANRRQVRIETVFVSPSSFEDVIEITGAVEAYNDATVSAQVSGTINYRVPRGSYIRSNRVIVLVDSTLMHAAYMQGKAQLDVAKAQYDLAFDTFKRQEPLFQDSIISALEFESVRAQYNQAAGQLSQAKAIVAQAQEQLDNTKISSPFSGTVETYFAELGEQVAPGSPIVRVVNTQRVKIVAGVPERYANEIEKGTAVRIAFDNYGNSERAGVVSFVGNAINPMSRTFPIEIVLDNSDQELKPEMVASLFLTRDEIQDVLVVPQAAVPLNEEGHTVFVVVQDTDGQLIAERRSVTLGPSYDGNVVVENGLEAGDQVVVNGQYNLTNGDAVEVVNTTSDTVASL